MTKIFVSEKHLGQKNCDNKKIVKKNKKNGPVKVLKKSVKLVKACFVTPGMD